MTLHQALFSEWQHEATNTQKILGRIPNDKLNWKPHPKSRSLKDLAIHICKVANWGEIIIRSEEYDIAAMPAMPPDLDNNEIILHYFNQVAAKTLNALQNVTEAQLDEIWIFRREAQIILQMPKAAVIRRLCLNHLYHHRGQLGVYFRMLDIPVPGMYGPSADDLEHFKE